MKPTSLASLSKLTTLKKKLDSNQLAVKHYEELNLDDIYSIEQPRKKFRKIEELAQSMKELGQQTPITVNPDGKGKYIIEQGERRYRAAKLAGLEKIAAVIRHSDKTLMRKVGQIAENVQRDDMVLADLAESIHSLVKAGMTVRELARRLGKKESYVSALNGCAELPAVLQTLVDDEHIKDPIALTRLKNAYKDHPDEVTLQIARWSNAPVSDVSADEQTDEATFLISRSQVTAFVKSLRDENMAQPATKDVDDFMQDETPARVTDPMKSELVDDDYEEPPATPIPSPTEKGIGTLTEKGNEKFHQDETSETIPEGYARCSSTDFRVFVTVNDLGEGFITPNIIPPQGKISVTLMGDGKTVEVDPHHVTILSIGTKYQHARP